MWIKNGPSVLTVKLSWKTKQWNKKYKECQYCRMPKTPNQSCPEKWKQSLLLLFECVSWQKVSEKFNELML